MGVGKMACRRLQNRLFPLWNVYFNRFLSVSSAEMEFGVHFRCILIQFSLQNALKQTFDFLKFRFCKRLMAWTRRWRSDHTKLTTFGMSSCGRYLATKNDNMPETNLWISQISIAILDSDVTKRFDPKRYGFGICKSYLYILWLFISTTWHCNITHHYNRVLSTGLQLPGMVLTLPYGENTQKCSKNEWK